MKDLTSEHSGDDEPFAGVPRRIVIENSLDNGIPYLRPRTLYSSHDCSPYG
jgi:hypothetical protein